VVNYFFLRGSSSIFFVFFVSFVVQALISRLLKNRARGRHWALRALLDGLILVFQHPDEPRNL
jgi:hypothetical protein